MTLPSVWQFKQLGTPENILLKAGMVAINDSGHDMQVTAGPKLPEIFADAIPPLEQLTPPLTDIVRAKAFDKSQILTGSSLQAAALKQLREMGVQHKGIQVIMEAIDGACQQAALEITQENKLSR